MAYATPRQNGTWELRESVSTPKGPRSRTLASFRTLSQDVIEQALERAEKPLSADDVRNAARRAGAPVDLAPADRAASDLLRELADGSEPHPILRALLIEALQEKRPVRLGEVAKTGRDAPLKADVIPIDSLQNARASANWLAASPSERGAALYDLLLLADRFPRSREQAMSREPFPGLNRAS
jgi:hypothetical protein